MRIKKAKVDFISLCPKGANRMPVMYKADDNTVEFDTLLKASADFAEKGELLAVVYAPGMVDSQGDHADPVVIRDMAHAFAKEGKGIDIRHNNLALSKEQVFVAESFIVQPNDPRFADFKDYSGKPVNVTGAWATLLKIEDPNLRQLYKEGKWNGVSMGGSYERESDEAGMLGKFFKELAKAVGLGGTRNEEIDMTPEQMAEVMKKNNETLVEMLKTMMGGGAGGGMTKEQKAAADAAATAVADAAAAANKPPEFKGNPMKLEDVQAHEAAISAWHLRKTVDWSDPVKVAAYTTELKKQQDAAAAAAAGNANPRIAALEKELLDLKKASNTSGSGSGSGSGGGDTTTTHFSGMEKADQEAGDIGARMAKYANTLSGRK